MHHSPASFFAPPPETGREELLNEYLQVLEVRNGTLRHDAKEFPTREAWLSTMNAVPVRYHGHIDPQLFERLFTGFDPRAQQNPQLVALLAFVKMNAGEAYGIEAVTRARHNRPVGANLLDRIERIVSNEERYHSRILIGATHMFGLSEPKSAYRPPLPLRTLIGALMYAPRPVFHSVLLAAEVGGLFAVNWMLGRVRKVFGDQPEVRDQMEARLIEIIVDEIGHVAFNRLAIGPLGMRIAEKMAPEVGHSTAGITPEFAVLGWDRNTLAEFSRFNVNSLPTEARKRAFFA